MFKKRGVSRIKLQSAMEYLMTYGWAILIIAVVLGSLFQLGVFNSSSFSPRAPPGACQVFRPGGPNTATNINLMGVCTGQLPQYVGQFNGQISYASTGTTGLPLGNGQRSVFAWVYLASTVASRRPIYSYGTSAALGLALLYIYYNGGGYLYFDGGVDLSSWIPITANAWHFVGYTYGGGSSVTLYSDGQTSTNSLVQLNTVLPGSEPSLIGKDSGGSYFIGSISNIQVYNTSLTANQVQALYIRGIGGAPSPLQNIVAWWPLNGDVKDYGGNNDNGVPSNVAFTNQYGK